MATWDWTTRARALLARARHAPGAGRRRHAELVERDDREHHLLWSLHERTGELAARLDRMEERLARLDVVTDRADHLTIVTEDTARKTNDLTESIRRVRTDLAALAIDTAALAAPHVEDGPLVSVVMPTWQRARLLPTAIASVQAQTYPHWELVIVDDGSDDDTGEVVAPLLDDDRISYVRIDHAGEAAARNRALEEARGEIVAYLDTDNTWHPTHLARHVRALVDDPDVEWSIAGLAFVDGPSGQAERHHDLRSLDTLRDENFIDINVLAHRRSVVATVGGFDTSLTRLTDWDFVLRLAALGHPARTGATTVAYGVDAPDRVTATRPLALNRHRVRARHRGRPAEGLRVLFAEWHFPQITESYIAALAQGLVELGADVEVWGEVDPSVLADTPLRVHRGSLDDAVGSFRPHLVLSHWLHMGHQYRGLTRRLGLPHVVRAHGFEFDADATQGLLDDGVLVHVFPHLVDSAWADHSLLVPEVTCFDDRRYGPSVDKDRRLVLRTAAGLRTKDIETFLRAADLCPDHRFVLVLGHALHAADQLAALRERAAELGSRCEILTDVPQPRMAELMGEAGIYLHTHGTDQPFGMSVSIAEAMATGAYVVARHLPGMAAYVGDAGALYDGDTVGARAAAAARLVRATTDWTDQRWDDTATRSVDQAYARHASRDVAERMVTAWRRSFPDLP